jgi:leucyl aminopeptidase
MTHPLLVQNSITAVPVYLIAPGAELPETLSAPARAYLAATGFKAASGKIAIAPGPDGAIEAVLLGIAATGDILALGRLATALPAGDYRIASPLADAETAALAFLMSSYRFTRYKAQSTPQPRLQLPDGVDARRIAILAESTAMARDLINTPAADLPPEALALAALSLADQFGATSSSIVGDKLIEAGFPMVHAVGRAAGESNPAQAPRLVEFTWGRADAYRVTLVGKGVCFDTGGLNIKPESAMLLMKKDMGGAAIALATARMIMALDLPVRLRVILPIVENSIAGTAFRPGDVLQSRKGITVEIGNTDAEGRLILGDALALAAEEAPELLINYATLTGAARVAVGPDLPAAFFNDETLAADMLAAGMRIADPCWRLPLWDGYDSLLDSTIADVNHIGSGGMAGAILAALFLRRFVPGSIPWAHIDTFAWRPTALPGRPAGGEPQTARATLALIEARLSSPAIMEARRGSV